MFEMRSLFLIIKIVTAFIFAVLAFCNTPPAFAAPPAKAFGELPVGFDAAISPDGEHIAVILNVEGEYGVLTKTLKPSNEEPWFLKLGEGLKPRYVKWVNNERFVVSINRSDEYQGTPLTLGYLFTASFKTRDGKYLIMPDGMFRQFNNVVVDWLEDDPEHILMAYSDREFDSYPDIKKVNVRTGRGTTIQGRELGIEYWITDDNGTPKIGRGSLNNGEEKMVIYDSSSSKWLSSNLYPGLSPKTNIFGIFKDGKELVIGDYNGRDTLGLYIYNLDEKRITRSLFHNDNYDASGVILSKDGETVIGAKYTADTDKTELLGEYGTLLDRMRANFGGYDVDFVDQTQDGKTVIVSMSAPYDPGGLFLYSSGDKAPTLITMMQTNISSEDLGDVISVSYKSRDGTKIPAFVTLPPTILTTAQLKELPFIVLPHGGPYSRDSKRYDYFAQFFATRGYGVLQMNFRGSEGYGKSFADAGRSNWIVMQEDVEDGTRWLIDKGYADPNRTCIAGWSYGGYVALMGAAKNSNLYKCSIAMAALTDIVDAMRDFRDYRGGKKSAKTFFGEAMNDPKVRSDNSPVKVADQIKIPVFLAHGDQDENVQFDQFKRMKRALKKSKVRATFLEFEDEDHYLSTQKNREEFFIEIEKFLKEVNGVSEYMAK